MDRLASLLQECDEKAQFATTHLANIIYYTLNETIPYPVVRQLIAPYSGDLLRSLVHKLKILREFPLPNRQPSCDRVSAKVRTCWDDVHDVRFVRKNPDKWYIKHKKPDELQLRIKNTVISDLDKFILSLQSRLSNITRLTIYYAFRRHADPVEVSQFIALIKTQDRMREVGLFHSFWQIVQVKIQLEQEEEEHTTKEWEPPTFFEIFPELRQT